MTDQKQLMTILKIIIVEKVLINQNEEVFMRRCILICVGLILAVSFCEKEHPCGTFDTLAVTDTLVNRITLSWDAPCPEAYDYDIYRSTSRKGAWVLLQTVSEADLSDPTKTDEWSWTNYNYTWANPYPVVPDVKYYYKVVAKPYLDTEWEELSSNIVTGMALAGD